MYEVVRAFIDSRNGDHLYSVGDVYPVEGYRPRRDRVESLLNGTNKNGVVYIRKIADEQAED